MAGINTNSKPTMAMTPLVAVVLVQYAHWQLTAACLESLFGIDYPTFQIIVVDNGSSDDSANRLEAWASEQKVDYIRQTTKTPLKNHVLTILDLPQNRGYAGGNNAALQLILSKNAVKYVWLLNNDTEVEPSALSWLVYRLENDLATGLAGSTILHAERRTTVQAMGGGYFLSWLAYSKLVGEGKQWEKIKHAAESVEKRLDFILGASCLVRREFLEQTGLMDESLFLYFEELDWCLRARGRFSLAYAPESIVYHREGASIQAGNIESREKNALADYYFHRNRLVIVRRYFPTRLITAYASLAVTLLRRMAKRQWDRLPIILKAGGDALRLQKRI